MITHLKKGRERKDIVTSRAEVAGSRSTNTYRTLVFPSDKNGRVDLKAERSIYSHGPQDASGVHISLVKEFRTLGWEVVK